MLVVTTAHLSGCIVGSIVHISYIAQYRAYFTQRSGLSIIN